MVIFYSYVSLPEGNYRLSLVFLVVFSSPKNGSEAAAVKWWSGEGLGEGQQVRSVAAWPVPGLSQAV